MYRFIFTFGFTGKTAQEFFDLLRHAGVKTVMVSLPVRSCSEN